jgi:hypothetical protein
VVTSAADIGAGTLRNAIASAGSGTVITFALPQPSTITLSATVAIGRVRHGRSGFREFL